MGASLTKEDYRAAVEHVTCDVECEPLLPTKKCDFECILCYDYTDRVIEPSVYIDNMIDDDSSDISEHTPLNA